MHIMTECSKYVDTGRLFFHVTHYHTRQKPHDLSIYIYYIPINDTTFKLSVFWPSDTESRINELRFSDSVSLSFKTRLMLVTCFCGDITYSKFQAWTRDGKHDDVTSRNVTLWQTFPEFFGIRDQNRF